MYRFLCDTQGLNATYVNLIVTLTKQEILLLSPLDIKQQRHSESQATLLSDGGTGSSATKGLPTLFLTYGLKYKSVA